MKSSVLNPAAFYLPARIENRNTEEGAPGHNNKLTGFGELLQEKLSEVNSIQKEADQLTESFLAGEPVELHRVMLSMERADLALQLTVRVRNKLVEAYHEVSRMQI